MREFKPADGYGEVIGGGTIRYQQAGAYFDLHGKFVRMVDEAPAAEPKPVEPAAEAPAVDAPPAEPNYVTMPWFQLVALARKAGYDDTMPKMTRAKLVTFMQAKDAA